MPPEQPATGRATAGSMPGLAADSERRKGFAKPDITQEKAKFYNFKCTSFAIFSLAFPSILRDDVPISGSELCLNHNSLKLEYSCLSFPLLPMGAPSVNVHALHVDSLTQRNG